MNMQRFCGALGLSIFLLTGPLAGLAGAAPIPSDFDDDGDVDLADFAEFQTCVLGPDIPQMDPVCSVARLDADEDVDAEDFEVFQGCLSGEGNPADPNCACPSGQTNCDGTCVNTVSDSANCGVCGNVCPAGTTCTDGVCCDPNDPSSACYCGPDHPYYPNCCPGGQTFCSGGCTQTDTDNANCGTCGNVCPGGTTCVSGSCEEQGGCGQGCPVGWVCYVGSCCNPTSACCADPCP